MADNEPALRILAIANRWPTGTSYAGVYVKEGVEALRRLGHSVDVEIVADRRGKLDYFLAASRVRRLARAAAYDVVHVHYGLCAPSALLVSHVPRLVTLYGSDVNISWQRWISLSNTRSYAARIYVSQRLADTAADASGVVIPNGVDFRLFQPSDRTAARAAIGASVNEYVILFGGAPENWVKGWDVFCEVVARLKMKGLPIRQLVLSEAGQSRRRVAEKIDAADLLLFTSRRGSEGSPTVVKEAIVMGLPVVSVDVGDVAELLAPVVPSAVVPFPERSRTGGPSSELIDRLVDASFTILRQRRRSNGREVCRWLNVDDVAERVVAVYRRAVDR